MTRGAGLGKSALEGRIPSSAASSRKTRKTWQHVRPGFPCPICKRGDWCSVATDGTLAICRRIEAGGKYKMDRNGVPFWMHRLDGSALPDLPLVSAGPGRDPAPDADLARVYARLLDCLSLADRHRADLRRRGLTDEQIDRAGYRTLPLQGRAELLRRLGEDFSADLLLRTPGIWLDGQVLKLAGSPGLLIPVRNRGENVWGIAIRPDDPGEGRKYVWLSSGHKGGCRAVARPHVPMGTPATAETIRMTEGSLKADVAAVLDTALPCLGLPGLAWRTVLPLLREMNVKTVRLAFDADRDRNHHVAAALAGAIAGLSTEGVAVLVEEWDGARGKGIDDALLVGLGIEANRPKEVLNVTAVTPPKVIEAPDDPHRLARLYLQENTLTDGLALRWWREQWYRWSEGAYNLLLDKEMKAELGQTIKTEFDRLNVTEQTNDTRRKDGPPVARKVTTRLLADVSAALTGLAHVPGSIEQPDWLDGDGLHPASELLVFQNGAVHLPSWAADKDCLVPLSPRLFTANALPYYFDPKAPEPKQWLSFLGQLWRDAVDAVAALQEWFGYHLLPDTCQQKIAMLVGPRRSGKGTIGRVLTQLIGPGNVCAPTLASLGGPFGLQPLLGKTVALISDARLSGRTDTAVVVERLLAISGEDAQTIDRKFLSPTTQKLPVRFTILTNELPRLKDSSGALASRLLILRLTESFYRREDPTLTDRLLRELPGILLWAMRGWSRLRMRGHFVQPAASERLVDDMEDLASPVGAFVKERCRIGAGLSAPVKDVYSAWLSWCEEKGREPTNEQVFGRDLHAVVPGMEVARPRDGEKRIRIYEGITLSPTDADVPFP
jgi:putative DNA primase/helicase